MVVVLSVAPINMWEVLTVGPVITLIVDRDFFVTSFEKSVFKNVNCY